MKKIIITLILSSIALVSINLPAEAKVNKSIDLTEQMKESIVYLSISYYGYDQYRPWKHKDLTENWGTGCAVGKYEVIVPAWNVANAAFIKAKRYGQNEFISCKIKVIDYESNLCLISLEPNETAVPLKPVKFSENYEKGANVDFYWLSQGAHLYSGKAYLDRAEVLKSSTSYARFLNYIVANSSTDTGSGQVYAIGKDVIGIACWYKDNKEAGLIPGEIINRFLDDAKDNQYDGFGAVGFELSELLDPTMRQYLGIKENIKTGAYVEDVYNMGTGHDVLKKGDVIFAIDGEVLNPYGRFLHSKYDRLSFNHLITGKKVGQKVTFNLWRDKKQLEVTADIKNFKASEMLVPYYEYDKQPEYIVLGGFILQKLTRQYLAEWGDDFAGKVTPHFYHYYRDFSFKPTDERKNIIFLSYVLPGNINMGYERLGQKVVKKINGVEIGSMKDVIMALEAETDSKFHVIEFELDNPVVVISKDQLTKANQEIALNYGIQKLMNID